MGFFNLPADSPRKPRRKAARKAKKKKAPARKKVTRKKKAPARKKVKKKRLAKTPAKMPARTVGKPPGKLIVQVSLEHTTVRIMDLGKEIRAFSYDPAHPRRGWALTDKNGPLDLDPYPYVDDPKLDPPELLEIPADYWASRYSRWKTTRWWSHMSGGGHNYYPGKKRVDDVTEDRVKVKPLTKAQAATCKKRIARALGLPANSSWKSLLGTRHGGSNERKRHQAAWRVLVLDYLGSRAPLYYPRTPRKKKQGVATFNMIARALTCGAQGSKGARMTGLHKALWDLVSEGVIQHTQSSPAWFSRRRLN